MGMKKISDPMDDARWLAFRKALEDRGYGLKGLWHASDNIVVWAVYVTKEGATPPAHPTIITRFYEGGGFGVWLESRTNGFEEGAAEIIGVPKPETTAVDFVETSGRYFVRGHLGTDPSSATPYNVFGPGVTFPTKAEAIANVKAANATGAVAYSNPEV